MVRVALTMAANNEAEEPEAGRCKMPFPTTTSSARAACLLERWIGHGDVVSAAAWGLKEGTTSYVGVLCRKYSNERSPKIKSVVGGRATGTLVNLNSMPLDQRSPSDKPF